MQTTMINANITAYSTAVGPSSDFKNFFIVVRPENQGNNGETRKAHHIISYAQTVLVRTRHVTSSNSRTQIRRVK